MKKSLNLIKHAVCALALAAGSAAAHADWPERPIRLVVPSAAGGSPDILCRLLGAAVSTRLGQTVVVENRPGAAGNIGMQAVARAEPDGYTVGYGNNATLATNRHLFKQLPFDPDSLVPVVAAGSTSNLLVVNKDLPVRSVAELVAYAKANPGKLTMASAGNGTTSHLGGELFKSMAGLDVLHVPYRGSPQAIQDLIGGNVQFMFDNLPSILPSVQAGSVRVLAITAAKRSALVPDVPTMDEVGVRGYEMSAWGGFVVPAGTPEAVVARLNEAFNSALADPGVRQQLAAIAFDPAGGSSAEFSRHIAAENGKWAEVIRASGARID